MTLLLCWRASMVYYGHSSAPPEQGGGTPYKHQNSVPITAPDIPELFPIEPPAQLSTGFAQETSSILSSLQFSPSGIVTM